MADKSSECKARCRRMQKRIIGPIMDDLRKSDFYQYEFRPTLEQCSRLLNGREIEQIICYGLGEFTDGWGAQDSRYQLALLILMYEKLLELGHPIKSHIEIYDPGFKEDDKSVLVSIKCPKFKIIEENEHCARKIVTSSKNRCALLYMPHMDIHFYNNILGANWSKDGLSRLVILGNNFSNMADYIHPRLKLEIFYVNQLVENFTKATKTSSSRKKRKKQQAKPSKINSDDCQVGRALIELLIDDRDFERGTFSSTAFHLVDTSWLETNSRKIEESRIKDWRCKIMTKCREAWL